MTNREKVIKGLEICTKDIPMSNAVHKSDFCKECPYYNAENHYCWNQIVMMRDALALLKEQEVEIKQRKRPDCEHAEHDGVGCLGYCICEQDDQPIEICDKCEKYTGNIIGGEVK